MCCSVLQRVAVCRSALPWWFARGPRIVFVVENFRRDFTHMATYCNTVQRTAKHCKTLQHTPTHCNTLQHTATHCNTLQHTATHCNILQHTATQIWKYILQHTATQIWKYTEDDACVHLHPGVATNHDTVWRRLIGSPKFQTIFHKRATKYRALLRKMTCKDKGSYESSPPCNIYSEIWYNWADGS